ncbi:hypothetical protein YC2023_112292 [Brassica napus]
MEERKRKKYYTITTNRIVYYNIVFTLKNSDNDVSPRQKMREGRGEIGGRGGVGGRQEGGQDIEMILHSLTTLSHDELSSIDMQSSIGDNSSCSLKIRLTTQLVTNCHVRVLLRGKVLGSSSAKRINNLYGGVSEGSHVKS